MPLNRRIAILTLSVGSGHVRAAEMIQHALADGEDDVEVQTLDAVEMGRAWFRLVYVQPYWWMLRTAPSLWRALFERRHQKQHGSTAPPWVFRHGCKGVLNRVKALNPKLVIATEIAAAETAALGRREGRFNAPILAVLTDFHAEPPWAQREIDFYCVASEDARVQLIGWGVSPNRILVCGIPIDPAFSLSYDKAELRRSLGLAHNRPVVLVMGGGMGPAPLDQIVASLEHCGQPLQVVAVAGLDREMRDRVARLRGKIAVDLRVFGWADNITELMAASDLLITKPGGLTIAEALAMGLPMLLTHPIPGPEERHQRYLEQHAAAVTADTLMEIPRLASRLLANPQEREQMSQRAREFSRPDAAYSVAQVARAMLEKATYIELLANPPVRSGESAYVM